MIPHRFKAQGEVDHFGAFDFDFDKIVLSNDCLRTDRSSAMNEVPHLPSMTDPFSRVHTPMPLRPHTAFARAERAPTAISGSELLSLEGRPSPDAQMASHMPSSSQPSASATPALRRKAKFCGTPLSSASLVSHTQQSQRTQENIRPLSNDLRNVYNGSELPISPAGEWAQRFEQINLQPTRTDQLAPPLQSYSDVSRDPMKTSNGQVMSPREQFAHRKTYSETFNLGLPYNQIVDYNPELSHSKSRDIEDQSPTTLDRSPLSFGSGIQQEPVTDGALRQLRQAQSWSQAPPSYSSEFVSPSQILPDWLHDNGNHDVYYNSAIPYPTPASQESPSLFPSSDFASHGYSTTGSEDQGSMSSHQGYRAQQNVHYQTLPLSGNEITGNGEYLLSSMPSHRAPHTPPPSNPSASPTTPVGEAPTTPSPTKTTNRAARHKRSTIRLPKMTSNVNLNSSKSLSNLKAQKSMGNLNLKSRKSNGALASHANSQLAMHGQTGACISKSPPKLKKQKSSYLQGQGGSNNSGGGGGFGFMNYTPSDSAKILTGVAPSGSSKTKARRELEANEERRRLSLAAFKAIQLAGGDMPEGLKGELWEAGAMAKD